MNYEVQYKRVENTKELRFCINPDHENAVRDMVKYVMKQHSRSYREDRWEGDAWTADDVARSFSCFGERKELREVVQKVIDNEFRSACYYMLRELMPMMLRMRECLDDFPEGTDIGPKFDQLFYRSNWRG